jgi:hypothetical protein
MKFFDRLIAGLSIGGQKNLAKSINRVFNILENLEGEPLSGISVTRNGDVWRISYDGSRSSSGGEWDGTAPDGYEWETVNIVLDDKIVTRDILTKTSTKAEVVHWHSTDSRLLLQCNTSGVLRLDKGYLKS